MPALRYRLSSRELGRRIARGFRNFEHYRLRMLLITGGLDASPHTQL